MVVDTAKDDAKGGRGTMYVNRDERPSYQRAIEFLTQESQAPLNVVTRLYRDERAKLEIGARVTGFISILAIRNVRRILQQRGQAPAIRHLFKNLGERKPI